MNNLEFSNEFDILYNSIINVKEISAPPLDEYEKSVLLTKAQDQLVKNYFNPKGNKYGEGFDDSNKRQIDFYSLVIQGKGIKEKEDLEFDPRGVVYKLPNNILLVLSEYVETNDGVIKQVKPLHFEDYNRLMNKPFKYPLKNQVWKLIKSGDSMNVELIAGPKDVIKEYKIRYVKKPKPIILQDLDDLDLTINGESKYSECELDPIIHQEILDRAVELARASYIGDTNTQFQINQRNE